MEGNLDSGSVSEVGREDNQRCVGQSNDFEHNFK